MKESWPKVFRDPVHNLIALEDNVYDRLLLDLINTREVQRLRRIKQLGFSELVFPGANHSRFAHSLGVLHTAKKFLTQFERITGKNFEPEQRALVLSAALLHDIGHGPFSHAFERVTERKHEAWTKQIIEDPTTEVHQTLHSFNPQMPAYLASFFEEEASEEQLPFDVPAYLIQVVSSQLDADRCDYLLRDSYATGTNYGTYDLEWLISHLVPDQKRFYLTRKALAAAEAYVFARFHMYRTVYFHKTTRAAEIMLKLIFKRFKELLGESLTVERGSSVAPLAPHDILTAFTGQMSLSHYINLDDHSITEFLKACTSSQDLVLAQLGGDLLHRRLYKAVDATEVSNALVGEFTATVQSKVLGNRDSDYLFAVDTPADTPYKPYDADAEKPATQIYVEAPTGKPTEITLLSHTVEQLRKQFEMVRYYFPASIRVEIDKIAQEKLRKGKK